MKMKVNLAAQVNLIFQNPMHVYRCLILKVTSETVASALQIVDEENTSSTRLFIRMIDMWFDALNEKNRLKGQLKRKDFRLPYINSSDYRFRVHIKSCYKCFYTIRASYVAT